MAQPIRNRLFAQRNFRQSLALLILLSVVLGLLIVPVERLTGNIHTTGDGLWWAATTVTGVGYGDIYPVTMWGRLIGVLLQVAGVTIFGLVVGELIFVIHRRQDDLHHARESARYDQLTHRLERLEKET